MSPYLPPSGLASLSSPAPPNSDEKRPAATITPPTRPREEDRSDGRGALLGLPLLPPAEAAVTTAARGEGLAVVMAAVLLARPRRERAACIGGTKECVVVFPSRSDRKSTRRGARSFPSREVVVAVEALVGL